jgi:hypothetical protein
MSNYEIFSNKKYSVVRSVISKELRDFITQYALFDEMQDLTLERGDPSTIQVPNAHSKYGDPAMETVLLNLKETIEVITGLSLLPTYSYYRIYRKGDDLKPHIDRPACEISATLCFNYSYDDKKYNYPIYIEGNEINLGPGDMVIYKGLELSHWRTSMEVGSDDWQVQGFFHYVDANGIYTEWQNDKRNTIGEAIGTTITNQQTFKVWK